MLLAVVLTGLSACGPRPTRTISATSLESAPATPPSHSRWHMVSNPEALRRLYQPLGRRMGLIQVRNQRDWDVLVRSAPQIGPCPDLQRGIVVGLASETGTPLHGDWPFHWNSIRVCEGAGLIEASFNSGSYFPDGMMYLETAYVEDLSAVLVVAVDGVWYYPRAGESARR